MSVDAPEPANQPLEFSRGGDRLDEPVVHEATPPPVKPDLAVRTPVYEPREAEDFLAGKESPIVDPSRDSAGHFALKPGVEAPDAPSDTEVAERKAFLDAHPMPKPDDLRPSEEAVLAQGNNRYPGIDKWADTVARAGDRVWCLSTRPPGVAYKPDVGNDDYERRAPESGFVVPEGELHDGRVEFAFDDRLINQGIQVAPGPTGTYRAYIDSFEFVEDTPVAVGVSTENTHLGDGRTQQLYIPQRESANLRYLGTAELVKTGVSWQVVPAARSGR